MSTKLEIEMEIKSLHLFFVDWFSGQCEDSDTIFKERFMNHIAHDVELIQPNGQLLTYAEIETVIKKGYGMNPDFRIQIRNVHIRCAEERLVVAAYEEWQRNASNSTPPDNGRSATVAFLRSENTTYPWQWLHVQETWLSQEITELDAFNF